MNRSSRFNIMSLKFSLFLETSLSTDVYQKRLPWISAAHVWRNGTCDGITLIYERESWRIYIYIATMTICGNADTFNCRIFVAALGINQLEFIENARSHSRRSIVKGINTRSYSNVTWNLKMSRHWTLWLDLTWNHESNHIQWFFVITSHFRNCTNPKFQIKAFSRDMSETLCIFLQHKGYSFWNSANWQPYLYSDWIRCMPRIGLDLERLSLLWHREVSCAMPSDEFSVISYGHVTLLTWACQLHDHIYCSGASL
jgi:hypothetical protein